MNEEAPYTVGEVCTLMRLSPKVVARLFEKEPGVIIYAVKNTLRKRAYRSIRIPRHVYARVVRRFTVG
jgi:hypothetical protein